jgi:hypothetical protein
MRDPVLLPALALVALSGCVRHPVGATTPHVPGIRIISRAQASTLGLRGRPREFRFGPNQDGTKLVLDFLDEAKRAGGLYVSDIRIILTTRRQGAPVSCETRLSPRSEIKQEALVPKVIPGRTETRHVLKPVTRMVTEHRYRCRSVSRPVTSYQTTYQSRYDYASKSYRSVPVTRPVTRYQHRNECRTVPVTRTVTRYEYQLETKYIPPRLTYLSANYTDFNLIETRPVCSRAGAAEGGGGRLPHRISGTVYYQEAP